MLFELEMNMSLKYVYTSSIYFPVPAWLQASLSPSVPLIMWKLHSILMDWVTFSVSIKSLNNQLSSPNKQSYEFQPKSGDGSVSPSEPLHSPSWRSSVSSSTSSSC